MRIAFIANPNTGNGFYRAIGPMTALAARGHQVRPISPTSKSSQFADVRDVDVFHVHRYYDRNVELLIREAKKHGAAVTWDEDDDPGSVPKETAAYKLVGGIKWEQRLAAMKRIFRFVDLVTTPSVTLAERLRGYGAPHVEVIENFVPAIFLEAKRQRREGITIGWVAGTEHHLDAERLPIVSVLGRLLAERPDVHVVTIGVKLDLASERYRHIKKVLLLERHATDVAKAHSPLAVLGSSRKTVTLDKSVAGGLANYTAMFDIAIAPLADIPLNRSRSNVKLKEYAAGGAPWLASPVGPYANMGEKQGGRLVSDHYWYEELSRLIDSERARRKLAKNASKWVAHETLEANATIWESKLGEAIERSRASG